jgi:threonine dehydrogenase-like Zn-dependent dehydrogenase
MGLFFSFLVGATPSKTSVRATWCRSNPVSYVGVPHGVTFDGQALFFGQRRMLGGPAPVRRFLPDLMDRVLNGRIQPGKVFDLPLPIDQVAEGYKAMDQRRAIKTLLTV